MLKGIQRRFVEIKISGSKAYDSACFILRQGVDAEARSELELVEEARRIVGSLEPKKKKGAGRRALLILLSLLLVAVGAVLGFLLSLALLG